MRIAQISPLIEPVPPKGYGGTERIVSYLTEELVKRGHDVTLFASGDSRTSAKLIPVSERGLRQENIDASLVYHIVENEKVARMARHFDILHFHNDYLHFPVSSRNDYAHVTTLHGRLDIPALKLLYKTYSRIPLVSISNHQRGPLAGANWAGTVYHGLPLEEFSPNFSEGKYLAFLGRISVEKRVDRAIEIAKLAGMKLKVAAKVDPRDKEYYESVKHLLQDPMVEFIGEINEREKADFLGQAAALLFPIDWPEPFGLVMVEAMAFGTPVIAFGQGSVPEIIDEGITGFVVSTVEEAAKTVARLPGLSRASCRKKCEERFHTRIMAGNYEKIYEQLAKRKTRKTPARNLHIKRIRTTVY